ncbi:hypothetical protein [Nonomuraea basaltis]|uniref:hypothetical protein n=1 Tax=Nonomuraea basaltis TaxID=2495887 RepID=UPI001486A8DD|nr:hypothetical protein [Nonomuraea basaltis]
MTEADERMRRWRLVLGGGDADGTGCGLQGADVQMDAALAAVYDLSPIHISEPTRP